MKPCVFQIHELRDGDKIGCANTRDLIHNGTVPVSLCDSCPYRQASRWHGVGDLVKAALKRCGVAQVVHWWRGATCGCSKRQHWLNRWLPFRASRDNGRWAVVVTTAPRAKSTIEQCIASIRLNGWEPVVFAEPGSPDVDCLTFTNSQRLGVWHNWLQSCRWALENTDAELILTVQDDSVLHHESREYVEAIDWPERAAFVSLYTPKHYGNGAGGLKRVKTRSMWGACALVWRRNVLEQVISHKIARNWLGVPPRGRIARQVMAKRRDNTALVQNSDTAIGRIVNAMRLDMYFVDPSPVTHVAEFSSINHGGNRGKRNCGSCADHRRSLRSQVRGRQA
jgi:hypothetical protein